MRRSAGGAVALGACLAMAALPAAAQTLVLDLQGDSAPAAAVSMRGRAC